MDTLMKEHLRNGFGSIGETAKTYAISYRRRRSMHTSDKEEFLKSFLHIIYQRIVLHEIQGINDKNLLIPFNGEAILNIYSFLDRTGSNSSYELDLPTMILYTMLLESNRKREGFAEVDKEFIKEALKIIYQETNAGCSYQTAISEDEFVKDNSHKIGLFLLTLSKTEASEESGLNLLDREIFFLRERISFEEYKEKLAGINYTESISKYSKDVSSYLEFNWKSIAPDYDRTLEQFAELKTKFYDKITSQVLYFDDGLSADLIFKLFENDSNWILSKEPDVKEVSSRDEKYVLIFRDNSEDFSYSIPRYILHLIYKGVD